MGSGSGCDEEGKPQGTRRNTEDDAASSKFSWVDENVAAKSRFLAAFGMTMQSLSGPILAAGGGIVH
jgi:hypothetical protein